MTNKHKALADTGLIEVEKVTGEDVSPFDVDIVFKLDVKKIAVSSVGAAFGHQLMLLVTRVEPEVSQAGITLRHLMDLGVLIFTSEDPDLDAEVVCFEEDGLDYWASSAALRKVWATLLSELKEIGDTPLELPERDVKRPLQFAITGMKYFNGFISPDLLKVPAVYLSPETVPVSTSDADGHVTPLTLFKTKIFG
jgi:hypothetical protein